MAIQFGTVDGLVNISEQTILLFVKAINEFILQGGPTYAKSNGFAYGTAFQRYIDPVYYDNTIPFDIHSILTPVYTKSGKEQSPARITFCKKMGLLEIDEQKNIFNLTPLGREILNNEITIEEYAFILLTKMGVFKDGVFCDNVFYIISSYFQTNSKISPSLFEQYIKNKYNDTNLQKTRIDIILNAIATSGLISKVTNDLYVLSNTEYALIFSDFYKHKTNLNPGLIDTDNNYSNYIGSLENGIFDVLSNENVSIYNKFYPNLKKYMKGEKGHALSFGLFDQPLQQIFYGAPGTGKSHKIKDDADVKAADEKNLVFRTTFHPDSDYSAFVGAYKPTTAKRAVRNVAGDIVKDTNKEDVYEDCITYSFIPQAFLQAYVAAWNNPDDKVFLVIEEINRGNCAQIFGDLFQLLDRDDEGASEYPIMADKDIAKYLNGNDEEGKPVLTNKDGIKDGKLRLPKNLHIWATMNTSDQSLFPIDSAFKRRWDWVYMPIADAKKNYVIEIDNDQYDWWNFLEAINAIIESTTHSEDKKLGYFFAKAKDGRITVETFVSKVIFYLWNDVFKDNETNHKAFKDNDGELLPFRKFFHYDGTVDTNMVIKFLQDLEVFPFEHSDDGTTAVSDTTPNTQA